MISVSLLLVVFSMVSSCNNSGKGDESHEKHTQLYRCPMHHEIVREEQGSCPICGMDLVPFGDEEKLITDINLHTILQPTNSYVLSSLPVTSIEQSEEQVEIQALGMVQYDTRETGSISSNVGGRIEKLYLRSTFQQVHKGQKVMDIYSPELLTAQQNLLFLVKNDPGNEVLIKGAKEKLLLLGMSNDQLQQVLRSKKPSFTVSVYSRYSGHIHDALGNKKNPASSSSGMEEASEISTRELMLKEGMYVQKGQTLLSVFNPHKLWAVLNIYAENQGLVKVGNPVRIVPESAPGKDFRAKINFIEPFLREGSKTATIRVYFDNHQLNIPVGSQVRATIFGNAHTASWLPREAVISLGLDQIVFKQYNGVFKAISVETGLTYNNKVEITKGLTPYDEVAANASYLMDSESFIKANQ
ncbi:MAG: efflux RND transporter periplasmic adaptor subunit [Chitinophagaceae bacterium]